MESVHLAWAAGFFDGEGYIGITSRRGGRQHQLRISIAQVNRPAMEAWASLFGGTLYERQHKTGNGRPFLNWVAESRRAEVVLRAIDPYLIGKRAEAAVALAFQDSMARWGNKHHAPTDEQVTSRDAFRLQLVALHGGTGKNQAVVAFDAEAYREQQRIYASKFYAANSGRWKGGYKRVKELPAE